MTIKKYLRPILLVLGVIIALVIGCSKSYDPLPSFSIKLSSNPALGDILVDNENRALYYFANDANGSSSCAGDCLDAWPVFHLDVNLAIHPDLNKNDFSTIARSDGRKQTTYKGWPLYYYAKAGKKEDPGKIGGQGVDGVWFVAKPGYAISYANAQLVGADGNHYKSDFTPGDEVTRYFTDDRGRTLYLFTRDKSNINTFTNSDYSNNNVWSIFFADLDKMTLSGTLSRGDFGVISVGTENRKQLTYKGWPLYYFGQDTHRGDSKGISFPMPNLWHVASYATPLAPH